MKIDGRCHCGAIQYEADINPKNAIVCHCTDCQTLSGSPFRVSVPAKAENFRLLRGEPQIYVKTADSGAKRAQGFCGTCGTQLYSTSAVDPTVFNLRTGAIRQRAELPPQKQIWCKSAIPWAAFFDDIPSSQTG